MKGEKEREKEAPCSVFLMLVTRDFIALASSRGETSLFLIFALKRGIYTRDDIGEA